MQLAEPFGILVAGHLREPVIEAGKQTEHGTERQHIVEVRNDVIGVVKHDIEAGIRQHHAGHTADGEQEDETNRPEHRDTEGDRATPHRRNPGEDLNARRNRNHHRRRGEIGTCIDAKTHSVHVVRPDDEADKADRHHRIGHAQIAEDRLFREGRDDVADNAKGRQDHDVHLWMAKEPEEVQEQDRVAAAFRNEEGGAEVTVCQQHGDRTGKNRNSQQQQECGHEHRPYEQRHLVKCHAGCAHVEDRGDEVRCAKD